MATIVQQPITRSSSRPNCDNKIRLSKTKKEGNLIYAEVQPEIKLKFCMYPFLQVALDIMGPLPESQRNKYILLIGSQFSKWYEAVALPNQEAKPCQDCLLKTG